MCEEDRDSAVGVSVLRGRQAQGVIPRVSAAQDVGYRRFISYHITGILCLAKNKVTIIFYIQ